MKDADRFQTLMAKATPGLRTRLRTHHLTPDDIEDVLAETTARAWGRFFEFDQAKGSFGTWLYHVALGAWRDANRATVSQARVVCSLMRNDAPEKNDDLPDLPDLPNIRGLSAQRVRAFYLTRVMGFSCAEAGLTMGIAPKTVSSYALRAARTLAAHYAGVTA